MTQSLPHDVATSPRTINLDAYLPHHITVIANKWARGSSRIYLQRFGLGVNEWRVLATVAMEPGCTANRVTQLTTVDKAIVSRAVKALEKGRYLTAKPDKLDPRRSLLLLTPSGLSLHDDIMQVALARQDRMFSGLSAEEITTLTRMILHIRGNLNEVNAPEFLKTAVRTRRRA